jgi:arylsulfatase A-like enzyme
VRDGATTERADRLLLVLALVLLQSCSGGDAANRSPDPPDEPANVVLIIADDLGFADLGMQGSADALTPHIDSLAAGGARLTHGYVSAPACSPTRAGLMTGRYQQRFGHELNPPSPSPPEFGLPLEETTLAAELQAAGYVTGLVGKWHLGTAAPFHPLNRGFDEFFGFLGGSHSYRDWDSADDPVLRGFDPVAGSGYLTDAFSREAVSFIRRHSQEPFFLCLSYSAVHRPMEKPPRRYMDRFPHVADPLRRKYLAMLAAMDDGIGRVLDEIRAAGLDGRTLVVFLSDNGGPQALNGSRNTPLRGGKEELYEGGIRVPFIVRWDGRVPAGIEYGEPVIQLDIFSTVLAAAGVAAPADVDTDGVDLVPFLDGSSTDSPHQALFWRYGAPSAVRKGDWKLVKDAAGNAQLFDLASDVGEATDLAPARPEVVSELERVLAEWQAELMPPPASATHSTG